MSPHDAPAEAYPLAWPEGWQRTPAHKRTDSQFGDRRYGGRQNHDAWARDHLVDQVRRLGGRGLILSTNVELRRDGLPRAGQRPPADPGVAAYWLTRQNEWRVVASDRWLKVWENMRAIGLTLEALRGLERWGASGVLERAFQGFAALPSVGPDPTSRPWWDVLGVDRHSTLDQAEAAYRTLARIHHPDRGGDAERMAALNAAITTARREARE